MAKKQVDDKELQGMVEQDMETIRKIRDDFKNHGIEIANDQTARAANDTPDMPDEKSWVERAKSKDLSQDQGKKPEGVHRTQTGWADRVMASPTKQVAQGAGRGGSAATSKPQDSDRSESQDKARTAEKPPAAKTGSKPTSWADRVVASRPQNYGHGKVDGPEKDAAAEPEIEKGKEKKSKAAVSKDKRKGAKPKAREKEKGNENENDL